MNERRTKFIISRAVHIQRIYSGAAAQGEIFSGAPSCAKVSLVASEAPLWQRSLLCKRLLGGCGINENFICVINVESCKEKLRKSIENDCRCMLLY